MYNIGRKEVTMQNNPQTTPEKPKLKRKEYEEKLLKLQIELCKLQEWVRHKGLRVVVIFEGRDAAGKGGAIKAILAVQVDTSSSVCSDIAAIGNAIRAARHDALFMVDTVASLGCVPFAMDAWGVDVAIADRRRD